MTARRLIGAALLLTTAAAAPPPPGASSCGGCHGGVAPLPDLAGRPAANTEAALAAFRDGSRSATVMGRIAKGFTVPEIQTIARWWAEQPR